MFIMFIQFLSLFLQHLSARRATAITGWRIARCCSWSCQNPCCPWQSVYHRCLQLHSQTQRRSCHAAGEDPMGIFDGFSMVFPLVCVVVSFCWFVHDSLRDAKVSPVPLSLKQPDNHSDSVQNPEVHIIQYISLYISIYISIYIYQYIYIYRCILKTLSKTQPENLQVQVHTPTPSRASHALEALRQEGLAMLCTSFLGGNPTSS